MGNQELQKWYYKIAYFFVANQIIFKRLVVILLLILNIVIWWPASVKMVDYFSSGGIYNKMVYHLVNNQVNYQAYKEKIKPKDLQIILVDKIKLNNSVESNLKAVNRYDLVAKIYNPNLNWKANQISYSFVVNGYTQDWQTDFILPGQHKYLFKFSYLSNQKLNNIDLKINKVIWQKIKDKEKINFLDNILVSNKNFDSQKDFSQVKFIADNQTSFGFWKIGWQVILYQSNRSTAIPLAVNYINSSNFKAGESREVSVSWPEDLPFPSKIEIIPDLDIFDQKNYILSSDMPAVNLIRGAKDVRN